MDREIFLDLFYSMDFLRLFHAITLKFIKFSEQYFPSYNFLVTLVTLIKVGLFIERWSEWESGVSRVCVYKQNKKTKIIFNI